MVVVFALAIQYLGEYSTVNVEGGSVEDVLGQSAGVLLEVLIKVAFLGVALAAGSVLLSKGVALLREGAKRGEAG